jgi:outer membrane protein TolC
MAVLEVTSAWNNLEKAGEAMKAQEDNVELARKTFEMFEEQYQEGFVSSLDVLDAEVIYSQARLGYISALREYLVSQAKLERAVRGGSSTSGTGAEGSPGVPMDSETGGGGVRPPEGSLQGFF